MSEIIDNDHINVLLDKVNLQELANGAVFELDTDSMKNGMESAIQKESQGYKTYHLVESIDEMPVSLLDDDDIIEAPGCTAFATLALKMTPLTDDGKIKKRILRPGYGPVAPLTALVEVHYDAYVEYVDESFDSTYLRRRTYKFLPALGNCIAGVCKAVTSMRKGEIAHFLIHYELGFGKLGVPPRIPKEAELLFEIQLINFIDGVQTKTIEELNGMETIEVEKAIAAKHHEGNESFCKKKLINEAIAKYNKALSLIDDCIAVDRADFEKYKPRMVSLCSNLALCHLKKKNYVNAVKICERSLSIDPHHCKSLFHYGRALLDLGEYDEARVKLLGAQKLEPTNKDINSELLKLENLHQKYKASIKQTCEKMFRQQRTARTEPAQQPSKWKLYLAAFKDAEDSTSFVLPTTIPATELKAIEAEAKLMGLIVFKDEDRLVITKQ